MELGIKSRRKIQVATGLIAALIVSALVIVKSKAASEEATHQVGAVAISSPSPGAKQPLGGVLERARQISAEVSVPGEQLAPVKAFHSGVAPAKQRFQEAQHRLDAQVAAVKVIEGKLNAAILHHEAKSAIDALNASLESEIQKAITLQANFQREYQIFITALEDNAAKTNLLAKDNQ